MKRLGLPMTGVLLLFLAWVPPALAGTKVWGRLPYPGTVITVE